MDQKQLSGHIPRGWDHGARIGILCPPTSHGQWGLYSYLRPTGFPRWHTGKESTCQYRRCKRCGFDPWVGKILWSGKWQPTTVFSSAEFHGQRSLAGYSLWGHKESDVTEHEHTRCHAEHLLCAGSNALEVHSHEKAAPLEWGRQEVREPVNMKQL